MGLWGHLQETLCLSTGLTLVSFKHFQQSVTEKNKGKNADKNKTSVVFLINLDIMILSMLVLSLCSSLRHGSTNIITLAIVSQRQYVCVHVIRLSVYACVCTCMQGVNYFLLLARRRQT